MFFTSEKCIYRIRVIKYTIFLPIPSSPLDAGRRLVPSGITENLNWETDSPSRMFVALRGLQMQMLEYYLKKVLRWHLLVSPVESPNRREKKRLAG